jgi:hypothetical protein
MTIDKTEWALKLLRGLEATSMSGCRAGWRGALVRLPRTTLKLKIKRKKGFVRVVVLNV